MIKFKSKCGYYVYRVSFEECFTWGGMSICDECNTFSSYGYLIPVLNHFMCPKCFQEWDLTSNFYPEDLSFEKSIMDYYESFLSFTFSDSPV